VLQTRVSSGTTAADFCKLPINPHTQSTWPYKPTSSNAWLGLVINSSHSPINLYEPRPSTAPVMESQELRDVLPPKHDLPFAQTLSRGELSASRSMKGIMKFASLANPLPHYLPLSRSAKHGPNPNSEETRPGQESHCSSTQEASSTSISENCSKPSQRRPCPQRGGAPQRLPTRPQKMLQQLLRR
jgi:hypothetical protein